MQDLRLAKAQAEIASIKAGANQSDEQDPADLRAESMTSRTRLVVAVVLVVAIVIGGAWVLFGTTPALIP